MFTVDRRDAAKVTLSDSDARSRAVLAPARGGMLIELCVAERELLYLDRKTFEEPTANVRGGVPVLFPSPGKLTAPPALAGLGSDAWAWRGARGSLKQHGFARNLPWEVSATGSDDGAWATLTLTSNETTLAAYPWAFRADYTYRLRAQAIAIEMRIENRATATMPFGAGFHPYFAVPDAAKARARIATRATRAWDNAAKARVPFTGFDLTAAEVDLHLMDHGSTESSLVVDDLAVHVRGSAEFTHWVVWTLRGRDFVCLEPWTCPGDALNTGERLLLLEPGEARTMRLEIARGA
jgi:galactose mutarotase-like enzyme